MKTYKDSNVPTTAVIFDDASIGIAQYGYFASKRWIDNQGDMSGVSGRSFGWVCWADQNHYRDDKKYFRALTEEEWVNTPGSYRLACLDYIAEYTR